LDFLRDRQCLGKKPRRRCENGKSTKQAIHERISRGKGVAAGYAVIKELRLAYFVSHHKRMLQTYGPERLKKGGCQGDYDES